MKRREIYRRSEKVPERGYKPGLYVVVSRNFIAENEDVVCAPAYSEILGLRSEVVLGMSENLPRDCARRCDFLTLMFKRKLTHLLVPCRQRSCANSTMLSAMRWEFRAELATRHQPLATAFIRT